MKKKPEAEKAPVTVMLDRGQLGMIESILMPGRTVADTLEELLVEPITREHFLQATAPREYYAVPKAVSDEEIAAFRETVADGMIEKALLSGYRKEVVAFGLLDAALELCTRICQDAGEKYPEQGGEYLAGEALRRLGGKALEKSLGDEASTEQTSAGDL